MKLTFSKNAWEDYVSWQTEDKRRLKRINELVKEILRTPFEGKGKPELLKYDLAGFWLRQIDQEHRLVYRFRQGEILIYSGRYHYEE